MGGQGPQDDRLEIIIRAGVWGRTDSADLSGQRRWHLLCGSKLYRCLRFCFCEPRWDLPKETQGCLGGLGRKKEGGKAGELA